LNSRWEGRATGFDQYELRVRWGAEGLPARAVAL
jgi:hypothetical protein